MPLTHKNRKFVSLAHQLMWSYCFLNLVPNHALADEFDTLQFRASVNKTYDQNLFRRANNEVSDQITSSTLGVKLDKTYSLQRVVLDLNAVDNKYNKNDYLDFTAKNYDGSWFWSLTPALTGTLSSSRAQSLNSFGDIRVTTQQNIRTFKFNQFNMKYSPHEVWGVIVGYSQMALENSEVFTAISDFEATGADYGVEYRFPSGSYLKLLGHRRNGEFRKRPIDPVVAFDDGYVENEYELNFLDQEVGKSKVTAKLGYLEREYNNFTIRNYDSYIGNISYDLIVTGKIRTFVNLSRLIEPFESNNSTYAVSDRIAGRLTYNITPKIQAGINASYLERDFQGRGQFDTSGRLDKESQYGVSMMWNPTNYIGLSLNTTKYRRNSSLANFDYDDTLTSVRIELRI